MSKRKGEVLEDANTGKKAKKHRKFVNHRNDERKQLKHLEFIEVTTKGRKIMPSFRKYKGDVRYNSKWFTRFRVKGYEKYTKYGFKTRQEAEAYRIEVNERHNLPKNIIYEYNNVYYCILTKNLLMKFSIEDIDIVEAHMWSVSDDYDSGRIPYARTVVFNNEKKETRIKYHQFIFTDLNGGESCDHINRDSLDNTRENLRKVHWTIQCINRAQKCTNINEVVGVSFSKSINSWLAMWQDENGKRCKRAFSRKKYGDDGAKSKALALRKEMETTLPHYRIALCID